MMPILVRNNRIFLNFNISRLFGATTVDCYQKKSSRIKDEPLVKNKGFTQETTPLHFSMWNHELLGFDKESPDKIHILSKKTITTSNLEIMRYLSGLRRVHDFQTLRKFLSTEYSAKWSIQVITEALRGLCEAEIYECSDKKDKIIAKKLFETIVQAEGSTPSSIHNTITLLHTAILEPSNLYKRALEIGNSLIFLNDVYKICAIYSLHYFNLPAFKFFYEGCNITFENPTLLYWTHKALKNKCSDNLIHYVLDDLSKKDLPFVHSHFIKFLGPFLQYHCNISNAKISNRIVNGRYSLLEAQISQKEVEVLKSDLYGSLKKLTESEGSIGKQELEMLVQQVESWKTRAISKKTDKRAIIVDSLNVTFGGAFKNRLSKVLSDLGEHFENIFIITRPHQIETLKKKFSSNMGYFVCNDKSEDDLCALYAALAWGPGAYVLTNDYFSDHTGRIEYSGKLTLNHFYRDHLIRFSRHLNRGKFVMEHISPYQRRPHRLDTGVHYYPTINYRYGEQEIPHYHNYLVEFPKL